MKILNNEKYLLNLVRYGAILLIIIMSIIVSYTYINQKQNDFRNEIKLIEENYINHNKIMVQSLVDKIHTLIEVEKKIEEKNLKKRIKKQVTQAHAIASAIYNRNIKKENY
jgi:hypothetical protein